MHLDASHCKLFPFNPYTYSSVVKWVPSRCFQAWVQSILSQPYHQGDSLLETVWHGFLVVVFFFFLFSVLVEVNRDNPQLCETLVLACLFFFWWPMTFFYARSGQLLAKVARGPFSGHSHAHSLPTHSSHLLSLCCDLRPQLWEESAWSIFNIETKVQSQAISGSDPDPNYLKNSLGDTQLPWGMRTIAQENL